MLNSVLLQSVSAIVQDTSRKAISVAAPGTPPAPKTEDTHTLLSMVFAGGYIMIPLAILSILGIYFIVERLIVINKSMKLDPNFMRNIKDAIVNGNMESAKVLCKTTDSPVARMVEKGISRVGLPTKEIENAMESVGKIEISRLEKNMGYLSLIAKLAPMFGFVGTILGVIKIFYDIALANNVEISTISTGLYQKMTSSAGGLIVGIMAFLGYYILSMKIDKVVTKMEKGTLDFMDILHEPGK